jgi:DNA-binding transcriptional MerR regulator
VHWKVKGTVLVLLTIGEMAGQSGVSVKALRYYDEIGIVRPTRRSPSGYRLYSPDTLKELAFVRSAQSLGLTLGEIREVIALRDRGEAPCSHVLALLQRRAEELDARVTELQTLRSELRRLARRARHMDPRDCDPSRICHLIEGTSPT